MVSVGCNELRPPPLLCCIGLPLVKAAPHPWRWVTEVDRYHWLHIRMRRG